MSKDYSAGDVNKWNYFGIDEEPPTGKVHVLTSGGTSILGTKTTVGTIAWAHLMKRDKEKEALQVQYKDDPEGLRQAGRALLAKRKEKDTKKEAK